MKTIKKRLLFTLIISLALISNVKATSNPYSQSGPYGTNCTWYAWQKAYEKAGIALPGFGNAKDWYNDAKNAGYSVGTTPKANSIVVWGNWTPYGHVGYVESVGNNEIYVWDSSISCIDESDPEYISCMQASTNEDTDKACKAKAKQAACKYTLNPDEFGITGYIYLDYTPTNNYTYTPPTTTEQQPIEEVIPKSNNTYLSNIEITNTEIKFNKETTEYNINVKNDIKKINIKATTEDSKSTVTGIGNYNLKVGLNEIKLTVTAEDSSTKDYIIKIIREKKEMKKQTVKNVKKDNNNHKILTVTTTILILITIISLVLKLILNKKTKIKSLRNK